MTVLDLIDQPANGITRSKGQRARRSPKASTTTTARKTLKLSLDAETIQNLSLHAMKADVSISEYVRDLVARNCVEWIVHRKPGPRSAEVGE